MADIMQLTGMPPISFPQFIVFITALAFALVAGVCLTHERTGAKFFGIILLIVAFALLALSTTLKAHAKTIEAAQGVAQTIPVSWTEKRAIENWCRNRKRDLKVCIPECNRSKNCN